MAGLNFVGNAAYEEALPEDETEVSQVAQFEFIPWILTQCATVAEAREKLATMRLTGTAFSEQLPTAQLHWIIADKDSCIVVESMKDGLHVYDNPVGVLTNNPPFLSQMFALNNYAGVSRNSQRVLLQEYYSLMHIAEEWVEWEYLEIFPASQDL